MLRNGRRQHLHSVGARGMNPSYQTPVYGGIRHPDDAVAIKPDYPELTMATSRSTEVPRPGRPRPGRRLENNEYPPE